MGEGIIVAVDPAETQMEPDVGEEPESSAAGGTGEVIGNPLN